MRSRAHASGPARLVLAGRVVAFAGGGAAGDYVTGCAFALGGGTLTGRYSAQGTSTESSVGESRATTYSAASSSERFSTTCVSRGGT